jgi:superoxide dismutase, Fe-Mn family
MNHHPSTESTGLTECSRRKFLALGGLAVAGGMLSPSRDLFAAEASAGTAEMMPVADGVFEVASLPYAYDALAPSIDEATMKLHHDKHYGAYTKNLNAALEKAPDLKGKPIEELLAETKLLPEEVRKALRNNGGGYYNHSLFWRMMKPGGSKPSGALAEAIDKKFTSLDAFKEAFSKEAGSLFGSGWAWLIVDPSGELVITSTPNQDVPIMDVAEVAGRPVLGLDVWEHAYYLKYKNVRPDYIKNWWEVVNWDTAGELYDAAKS